MVASGCRQSTAPVDGSGSDAASGPVVVIFELPEGEVRQEFADVAAGTTVAQLLQQIDDPPLTLNGSGAMTFLSSVGGLGTAQGQGWTFTVDGVKADRGVGSVTLTPPATVRWQHTRFADSPAADTSDSAESSGDAAEATRSSAEAAVSGR